MKLVLAVVAGAALSPLFLGAADESTWPCGFTNDLAKQGARIMWLSPTDTAKRATRRVEPKLPPTLRVSGELTVDIVIGTDGHVKCTRVTKGHPILKAALLEAARQWEFAPYELGSKPKAICGRLLFKLRQ